MARSIDKIATDTLNTWGDWAKEEAATDGRGLFPLPDAVFEAPSPWDPERGNPEEIHPHDPRLVSSHDSASPGVLPERFVEFDPMAGASYHVDLLTGRPAKQRISRRSTPLKSHRVVAFDYTQPQTSLFDGILMTTDYAQRRYWPRSR